MADRDFSRAQIQHFFYTPQDMNNIFKADKPEEWHWIDKRSQNHDVKGYIRYGKYFPISARVSVRMMDSNCCIIAFASKGPRAWRTTDVWTEKLAEDHVARNITGDAEELLMEHIYQRVALALEILDLTGELKQK